MRFAKNELVQHYHEAFELNGKLYTRGWYAGRVLDDSVEGQITVQYVMTNEIRVLKLDEMESVLSHFREGEHLLPAGCLDSSRTETPTAGSSSSGAGTPTAQGQAVVDFLMSVTRYVKLAGTGM